MRQLGIRKLGLMITLLGALSSVASATVINFQNLVDGNVITNQYAGVVFSSTAGNVNFVTTQGSYNGTPPNFLCTGPVGGGINCTAETIMTFSSGVSGLTFQGMGINDVSSNVAQVDVFVNSVFNSTITIAGNSEGFNPVLVNLAAFSNVTKIRIYNITDGGGIGWDTFTFNQSTSVPEPATFGFIGLGLAGAALLRRRRA